MKKEPRIMFIVVLVVVPVGFFITLAVWSNMMKSPDIGLEDGKLKPCSASPNCVCSEFDDEAHHVESVALTGAKVYAKQLAVDVIENMGGNVEFGNDDYIHATFQTPVFRFKDDFELRLTDSSVYVRSASRVGYSDLGKNRERAIKFFSEFQKLGLVQKSR